MQRRQVPVGHILPPAGGASDPNDTWGAPALPAAAAAAAADAELPAQAMSVLLAMGPQGLGAAAAVSQF